MGKIMWAALATLAMAPMSGAQEKVKSPNCSSCGKETYGTTIKWMGTPTEAATKAKAEEKLVFVLHVSGYFEDPQFT